MYPHKYQKENFIFYSVFQGNVTGLTCILVGGGDWRFDGGHLHIPPKDNLELYVLQEIAKEINQQSKSRIKVYIVTMNRFPLRAEDDDVAILCSVPACSAYKNEMLCQ